MSWQPQIRRRTCNECWVATDCYLVDAGMFGEKEICHDCYEQHYKPRPILEAPKVLCHGPNANQRQPHKPTGFDEYGVPLPLGGSQ